MENSMTPAEMANSANYAAMNYGELLNTMNAYTWAIGFHIDPLLKIKRLEEMEKITRAYVTAMNGYDATREEIIVCLEKVGMKENHMFSSPRKDGQTSSVKTDNRQNDGKSHLALPEPESTQGALDVNAIQESPEGDSSENDEVAEDDSAASSPEGDSNSAASENKDGVDEQMEPKSEDVVDALATVEQDSSETNNMTPGMQAFVDEALEVLKALPAPDDIDVNAPYYVEGFFAYGDSASPGYSKPTWRNMGKADLEAFRSATEKYEKLFLTHEVVASTDDYLVINKSLNSIKVRLYHFPGETFDGSETKSAENGCGYATIEEETTEVKKKKTLLKKAIKQAKEISVSIGINAKTAFYDRYEFKKNGNGIKLCNEPKRYVEDAEILPEIMSSFETYARLVTDQMTVLSKDNCVAAMMDKTIYLLFFNIPAKKKERKTRKKVDPIIKIDAATEMSTSNSTSPAKSVMTLVLNAVEMTKTLPICREIEDGSPYFVQRDFFILEDGEIVPKGKPFSRCISGEEELVGLKKNHCRFAKTMKATHTVSTDNYTAFIWNEGRSLIVFYYNTNVKSEAA